MKFRMGQNVTTAPQCLVVWVGDDNSGALGRAEYRIIVVGWDHCSPRKTPEGRFLLSSLIQPPWQLLDGLPRYTLNAG
jgi:hypothetical protein